MSCLLDGEDVQQVSILKSYLSLIDCDMLLSKSIFVKLCHHLVLFSVAILWMFLVSVISIRTSLLIRKDCKCTQSVNAFFL